MNLQRRLRTGIAWSGWILAAVAAGVLLYLLPRVPVRMLNPPPDGDLRLRQKQTELASRRWEDARPLSIWLGDSHVEYGDWYRLFAGAVAVRNCGMATATVRDVASLVKFVPDRKPGSVVVMCGINNLFQDSAAACEKDYRLLLEEIRRVLEPRSLIVLSVMPVRQNLLDPRSRTVNAEVSKLNSKLETLCREQGLFFLDITGVVQDADGGLDRHLTNDGLHLNRKGYEMLAAAIRKNLP